MQLPRISESQTGMRVLTVLEDHFCDEQSTCTIVMKASNEMFTLVMKEINVNSAAGNSVSTVLILSVSSLSARDW